MLNDICMAKQVLSSLAHLQQYALGLYIPLDYLKVAVVDSITF